MLDFLWEASQNQRVDLRWRVEAELEKSGGGTKVESVESVERGR